jgi:hypothetical protein
VPRDAGPDGSKVSVLKGPKMADTIFKVMRRTQEVLERVEAA